MALSYQQVFTAKDLDIIGLAATQRDGSRSISIPAGLAVTIGLDFGLPRATTANKGARLDSLSFIYQLSAGTLTSITAALTRITHVDDAIETQTNIPLNAASPAFTLTSSTNFNRSVTAVTTPAYDNQATTTDVSYNYLLTLTATSACTMDIHGAEVLYTLDSTNFNASSITGATVLTAANSGTWYIVNQSTGAYAITLPSPPVAGLNYKFIIGTAGANDVTVSNGSAHLFGTIVNDVTSVISVATGTTLTFANGVAAVGDSIEVYGIDATHYFIKAVTSANGGITIL